ncbi:MAG: hypothetical protein ACI8X5_001677 [Planctomycetota bacterium]|jgi:hypothetical protein
MLLVAFVIMGVSVLSLALFTNVKSTGKAQRGSRETFNALLVTEAGLADAMLMLRKGEEADIGSAQNPAGFGSASYWVSDDEISPGTHSLVSTGLENGVGARLELVVKAVASGTMVWAAFGDDGMTMDSNAFVDSYDSSVGTGLYEDQVVDGPGPDDYALGNGNIGSNADVSIQSNAMVFGDATPGPTGTASAIGNSEISGSTTPAPTLIEMPAIVVPSLSSSGDVTVSGGSTLNIPSGDHRFDGFLLDSSAIVNVVGPATLVIDNFEISSNSQVNIDATNGLVEIFVRGNFVMASNTLIASTTLTPADIKINLLSDNVIDPDVEIDLDEVDFNSNAKLYGTIYAPNASVEINSNFELFGSLVADRVHLDSNSQIHFDEALMSASSSEDVSFETVAWRQLPYTH